MEEEEEEEKPNGRGKGAGRKYIDKDIVRTYCPRCT